MSEYYKYRVHFRIRGGVTHASYEGYVDVWAENEEGAAWKAKQRLRRTSFPDVGYEDMVIKSVEQKPMFS